MDIRIAIIDDMEQDRQCITECTSCFFNERKSYTTWISEFSSAEEFLPAFSPEYYDLVFLDICMDEMNGIQLAQKLRQYDPHLMIVFQTTAREYAFDAFPLHPFDYLIKPCRQEEMDEVLSEALRVLDAGDPEITISAIRAEYSIPLRSIIAACSSGHNTELKLTNRQQLTSVESFKSISEKIGDDERFLLINRGVLINMDHVMAPGSDTMEMNDGSSYPIRVNGRSSVLSSFSQYMISKVDKRR